MRSLLSDHNSKMNQHSVNQTTGIGMHRPNYLLDINLRDLLMWAHLKETCYNINSHLLEYLEISCAVHTFSRVIEENCINHSPYLASYYCYAT